MKLDLKLTFPAKCYRYVASPSDRYISYTVLLFEPRMSHPALRVTALTRIVSTNVLYLQPSHPQTFVAFNVARPQRTLSVRHVAPSPPGACAGGAMLRATGIDFENKIFIFIRDEFCVNEAREINRGFCESCSRT